MKRARLPPTSTTLRCWAMKPPPARSLTESIDRRAVNWKSAMSLASGSLAMVSWYLIDLACFVDLGVEQVADNALRFVLALDGLP